MFTATASFVTIAAIFTSLATAMPPPPPPPNAIPRDVHLNDLSPRCSEPTSTGTFTSYFPGQGACGYTNTSAEYVVALAKSYFDPYTPNGHPSNNRLCGQRLSLAYIGRTVDATVVDRCKDCRGDGDLRISNAVFLALAGPDYGPVRGTWSWVR